MLIVRLDEPVEDLPYKLALEDGPLIASPKRRWFRTSRTEFTLSEQGGCACSLLAEDADWNAPTWRLTPTGRMRIAEMAKRISNNCPSYSIEAIWVSDKVESVREVSLTQFLHIVANDMVGTHERYRIYKGAASEL